MTDDKWVTVESPPQLTAEQVQRLDPAEVQRALSLGQLDDLLKPTEATDEPVPAHLQRLLAEFEEGRR